MMQFILISIVLVAIGLAFVLVPLLRARSGGDVDRARANLGILKDQLAELDIERQRGAVSDEHYAETKAELERRVLEEAQGVGAEVAVRAPWSAKIAAATIAVVLPVTATLVYLKYGEPEAFDPLLAQRGGADHAMAPEEIEKMLGSLRTRLQSEPTNANGWATLARTLYSMGRFNEAADAYAKLSALVPEDADILADYADALAMARGRKIAGEPMELINKALKLDPNQWKALAIAGTEAFDRNDFKAATGHWERLLATLPADAPIGDQIRSSIAEARSRGGMPPLAMNDLPKAPASSSAQGAGLPADHPPIAPTAGGARDATKDATKGAAKGDAKTDAKGPTQAAAAAAAATVAGTVDIGGDLKAKVAPTDRVFIFARPAQGSRMPVALTSVQVKDLPARFTLDETMAMQPGMSLAGNTEVIVGARVSKSGTPMPSSGDLEGLSQPVKVGAKDVAIKIDRVLP